MTEAVSRHRDKSALAEVYDRLNLQDKLLAKQTAVVEGLVSVVSEVKQTLDTLTKTVNAQSAQSPMSFLQLMGGAALVLGVGGSLAALIIVFVSSVYDGRLAAKDQEVAHLVQSLAVRDAEDRAELASLRAERWASVGERLKELEAKPWPVPRIIVPSR